MKKWAYPLALVTFAVFLVMAFNYKSSSFIAFDERIASILRGNEFIGLFHYLGETVFVAIVTLMVFFYFWLKEKNYRVMLYVVLTMAAGTAINQGLKAFFERQRPEIAEQLTSYSFPSGHSQMSVLYLFMLAYLFSKITTNHKRTTLVWIAAIVLACLIGLSRIAESRHFATDVLAGWSIGYTWFIICVIWYELRDRKYKQLRE
ncbi:phosphatase PAP2 family protein [Solibacillus daqui]|uniref:phosphatase PAP2 family protein n=1 Tax=Solibacillus daqui TaxID=2912187 RepID=UPI002365D04C|nr:phosphatase PAP2 family protein [Solibacillus daqui]